MFFGCCGGSGSQGLYNRVLPDLELQQNSLPRPSGPGASVLKRCVPETLAFAFGLRLCSKARRSKTRALGRRVPKGKPQKSGCDVGTCVAKRYRTRNALLVSGVEKLARSSLKSISNRALLAYKNGRFMSSFLLLGIGFL